MEEDILRRDHVDSVMEAIAQGVMDALGPGFSEAVYHTAFEVELRKMGYEYETERVLPVLYTGLVVGHVRLDIVVNRVTVIELKAVSKLNDAHKTQLKMYMRHGGFESGHLINFSDKGAIEVFTLSRYIAHIEPHLD